MVRFYSFGGVSHLSMLVGFGALVTVDSGWSYGAKKGHARDTEGDAAPDGLVPGRLVPGYRDCRGKLWLNKGHAARDGWDKLYYASFFLLHGFATTSSESPDDMIYLWRQGYAYGISRDDDLHGQEQPDRTWLAMGRKIFERVQEGVGDPTHLRRVWFANWELGELGLCPVPRRELIRDCTTSTTCGGSCATHNSFAKRDREVVRKWFSDCLTSCLPVGSKYRSWVPKDGALIACAKANHDYLSIIMPLLVYAHGKPAAEMGLELGPDPTLLAARLTLVNDEQNQDSIHKAYNFAVAEGERWDLDKKVPSRHNITTSTVAGGDAQAIRVQTVSAGGRKMMEGARQKLTFSRKSWADMVDDED